MTSAAKMFLEWARFDWDDRPATLITAMLTTRAVVTAVRTEVAADI